MKYNEIGLLQNIMKTYINLTFAKPANIFRFCRQIIYHTLNKLFCNKGSDYYQFSCLLKKVRYFRIGNLDFFGKFLQLLLKSKKLHMFCLANPVLIPQLPQIQILSPYFWAVDLTSNVKLWEPNINSIIYSQSLNFGQFQTFDFTFAQGEPHLASNSLLGPNLLHQLSTQEYKRKRKESIESQLAASNQTPLESVSNDGQFREAKKTQQKNHMCKNKSQTKNLIKNYGRAILTFILKSKQLRMRVLEHLKIDDGEFVQCVYMFRKSIHTISAIRYLWQQHPFRQAFRILSCEYLRKHNLSHIFNSRIFKHSVYLKYQPKLMKSLQRPHEFQAIKQI